MAEFKIISNSPLDQAPPRPRPLQSLYSESHLPLKVQVYLLPALSWRYWTYILVFPTLR